MDLSIHKQKKEYVYNPQSTEEQNIVLEHRINLLDSDADEKIERHLKEKKARLNQENVHNEVSGNLIRIKTRDSEEDTPLIQREDTLLIQEEKDLLIQNTGESDSQIKQSTRDQEDGIISVEEPELLVEQSSKNKNKKLTKAEKLEQRRLKAMEKLRREEEKEEILRYERENNDYSTYGVAFDLEHTKVTEADSNTMRGLKLALRGYLEFRNELLGKKEVSEEAGSNVQLIYNEATSESGLSYTKDKLNPVQREALGERYEKVMAMINEYTSGITIFKRGRARKRLDQVKLIREKLQEDNRRYYLSDYRRSFRNSYDEYVDSTSHSWPSYQGVLRNADLIEDRKQKIRDRERAGETVSFKEKLSAMAKNCRDRLAMGYHAIFGTVERIAAVPMMLAGNALKFAGKVGRSLLHVLSAGVNQCFKWAHSERRWRMPTSFADIWKKGWVGYNDGRFALRRIVSAGILTAVAPLEWVFGEGMQLKRVFNKNAPHFAVTRMWGKNLWQLIGGSLKDMVHGIGIGNKDWKALMEQDMKMADPKGGYDDDDEEGFSDTASEAENEVYA